MQEYSSPLTSNFRASLLVIGGNGLPDMEEHEPADRKPSTQDGLREQDNSKPCRLRGPGRQLRTPGYALRWRARGGTYWRHSRASAIVDRRQDCCGSDRRWS